MARKKEIKPLMADLKLPQDSKIMERKLGELINIFQISRSSTPFDLYNKCGRRI